MEFRFYLNLTQIDVSSMNIYQFAKFIKDLIEFVREKAGSELRFKESNLEGFIHFYLVEDPKTFVLQNGDTVSVNIKNITDMSLRAFLIRNIGLIRFEVPFCMNSDSTAKYLTRCRINVCQTVFSESYELDGRGAIRTIIKSLPSCTYDSPNTQITKNSENKTIKNFTENEILWNWWLQKIDEFIYNYDPTKRLSPEQTFLRDSNVYSHIGSGPKGSVKYSDIQGNFYYVDTLHKGRSAHVEKEDISLGVRIKVKPENGYPV